MTDFLHCVNHKLGIVPVSNECGWGGDGTALSQIFAWDVLANSFGTIIGIMLAGILVMSLITLIYRMSARRMV